MRGDMILEAFWYLAIGCAIAGGLWFTLGTLWIAFRDTDDHRTAKKCANPFNLRTFIGMKR